MARFLKFTTTLSLALICLLCSYQAYAQPATIDTSGQYPLPSFDRPINPDIYLIRPGERLVVTPLKAGIAASELVVGPEGKIVDARIGVIDVNGLTLTDVRKKLAEPLAGQYRSAQIDVSISGPRLVSISVTGAVPHPGTYQLWTSQGVVDAINRAGGLLSSASTRRIEIDGGPKRLIVDLDRVRFALDEDANLPLSAGTAVHVPQLSGRSFRVVGEVRKPREIELVAGDTRTIALALAGGVIPSGDSLNVVVTNDPTRPGSDEFLRDNDILEVPISRTALDQRGVSIFGAVKFAQRYPFKVGLTLSQLIEQAGGVSETAATNRAVLFRRASRLEPGSDTVPPTPMSNLVDNSGKIRDISLVPFDSIYVPPSIGIVRVTGQVRRPGTFPFTKGHTVTDYVGGAGGFTAAASQISVSIRNRVTGQIFLAAPESIVEDGDEVLISLTDGRR